METYGWLVGSVSGVRVGRGNSLRVGYTITRGMDFVGSRLMVSSSLVVYRVVGGFYEFESLGFESHEWDGTGEECLSWGQFGDVRSQKKTEGWEGPGRGAPGHIVILGGQMSQTLVFGKEVLVVQTETTEW